MTKVTNAQLKDQLDAFITRIDQSMKENHEEISRKIDVLHVRLDGFDRRVKKLEDDFQQSDTRLGNLGAQVETIDEQLKQKLVTLTEKVASLEKQLEALKDMPTDVKQLAENIEDRTNRQLRETLVFKNIPEEGEEDYKDTKELLATTISEHCDGVSYDFALSQIKRAHRESGHRRNGQDEHPREGKRLIYAAFHSWDLCQQIIETFREKCIQDRDFVIAADQKYGPKTSKRRQLAFQLRKQLKDSGEITSGFVEFPAKLMVNRPGETIDNGRNGGRKKVYRLHTNFSRHDV